MKILALSFITFFFCLSIAAQPLSYKENIKSSSSALDLEKRVKLWLATNTTNIENIDGIYTGNASTTYNPTMFYGSSGTKGVIECKVIISIDGDSYSYNITNFTHKGNPNNPTNLSFGELTEDEVCPRHMKGQRKGWENKVWKELKKVAADHAKELSSSIKLAMGS